MGFYSRLIGTEIGTVAELKDTHANKIDHNIVPLDSPSVATLYMYRYSCYLLPGPPPPHPLLQPWFGRNLNYSVGEEGGGRGGGFYSQTVDTIPVMKIPGLVIAGVFHTRLSFCFNFVVVVKLNQE